MDLDIKRVLAAKPGETQKVTLNKLTTVWGDALKEDEVLQEYPRPRMRRDEWACLNGLWDYAIVESTDARGLWSCARAPKVWDGKILVPFSPEASLSGVGRQLLPTQLLWYHKELDLTIPATQHRLLLHFGAVDYACALYVNGTRMTTHVGGYLPFSVDITDEVRTGNNTIELCVFDPSEQGTQLRGKQRLDRGNMWYTAQSGIWQTVWLEEVPACHIEQVFVFADADAQTLRVGARVSERGRRLVVEVHDAGGAVAAHASTKAEESLVSVELVVRDPQLWEPQNPYLYTIDLYYGQDRAQSYTAFRTVGVEKDAQGIPRFCLNHKPFFVRGLLDQGYWPDGLMTPPSDEALVADIAAAREAGFNLLRKHIKIEPERWYWHCDRLGMLVWQDMVSGGGIPGEWASANVPTLVRRSWSSYGDTKPRQWKRLGAGDEAYRHEWLDTARAAIEYLGTHPCITTWVVFNESWGQFSSAAMTEELRAIDSSRPFIATSGWYDQGAGDFVAVHNYFRSMRVYGPLRDRAFVINEFGGLTLPVDGHESVPTVYGYDTYEDPDAWREAVSSLLAEVDALEKDGLSGFVYTQVSDVEEETNGILTYDRRVNKLKG